MEKFLKIGWHGYGLMPYIMEIVDAINLDEISEHCWFITIDRFQREYEDYSNWEDCRWKKYIQEAKKIEKNHIDIIRIYFRHDICSNNGYIYYKDNKSRK